jgi:penicillin-binding protein 1C
LGGHAVILLALALSFTDVRAKHATSEFRLLDRGGLTIEEARRDPKGRRLPWVGLADLSPAFVELVVRAEDKRFRAHGGVDWRALVGAAASFGARGGSTITMQVASLVRHEKRGRRRGWLEKLAQMRAAWELEETWTKDQILETYVNQVSFRGELVGIAAASRGLFDKAPHGLDVAESSLLAALIRSPNAPSSLVARRACRLAPATCARATELAARLDRPYRIPPAVHLAPHLASLAREDAKPSSAIATTLDGPLQAFVKDSLTRHLASVRAQNVRDGAVLVVDNASGEVRAYVSVSGEPEKTGHVDGVHAKRQAGSTLKPFLYALALQKRLLTPASLLDDTALEIAHPRGVYRPANYDKVFHGRVPLRVALGSSLNVPAVRVLELVGENALVETLGRLGVSQMREGEYYGPALALIQGRTPAHMRSTVTGFTMLAINLFAIAIGNALAGAAGDRLAAAGSPGALTTVLIGTDVLALSAAIFFALAARGPRLQADAAPLIAH